MKYMNFMKLLLVAASTAFIAAGCDNGAGFAQLESQERQSRLYSNAMDDLQAGRVNAAIRGFEKVVIQEPKSYSAHFQLATLLQDVKRDYLGAIAHYRLYLLLRPKSDKATIATERMKRSEELLRAEALRKVGGAAGEKIAQENEKLVAEQAQLNARIISLEAELRTAQTKISQLTIADNKKRELLEKLSGQDDGGKPHGIDYEGALDEIRASKAERRRRAVNPTDKELLEEGDFDDSPNRIKNDADLKALREELAGEDGMKKSTIGKSSEVKNLRKLFEQEDKAYQPYKDSGERNKNASMNPFERKKDTSDKEPRPKTYKVKEGDTLYKIAVRFYNNGAKWIDIREANRATITPAGRVIPGQIIVLP